MVIKNIHFNGAFLINKTLLFNTKYSKICALFGFTKAFSLDSLAIKYKAPIFNN